MALFRLSLHMKFSPSAWNSEKSLFCKWRVLIPPRTTQFSPTTTRWPKQLENNSRRDHFYCYLFRLEHRRENCDCSPSNKSRPKFKPFYLFLEFKSKGIVWHMFWAFRFKDQVSDLSHLRYGCFIVWTVKETLRDIRFFCIRKLTEYHINSRGVSQTAMYFLVVEATRTEFNLELKFCC